MECKNHPQIQATDRCVGCAEPFCPACLVDIRGQKYCGSCKVLVVAGPPPVPDEATIPCKEADEALKFALLGTICFGIIIQPIAFAKALEARKKIAANPRLKGMAKVTGALATSTVFFVLWLKYVITRF